MVVRDSDCATRPLMFQAWTTPPMNRLFRRWIFLPLEIPTITSTVFQLLDLGHGQEN